MIGLKQLASLMASLVVLAGSAFLVGSDDPGAVALRTVGASGAELASALPVPVALDGLEAFELVTTNGQAIAPAVLSGPLDEVRLIASTLGRPAQVELGGQTLTVRPGHALTIKGLDGVLTLEEGELSTIVSISGLARSVAVEPPVGQPVSTLNGASQTIAVKDLVVDGVPITSGWRNAGSFQTINFTALPGAPGDLVVPTMNVGDSVIPFETEVGFALEDCVGILIAVAIEEDRILLTLDAFARVKLNGETLHSEEVHEQVELPPGGVPANSAPVAAFDYVPTEPTAHVPVEFVDRSVDDLFVSKWRWEFGDGRPGSNRQHPTHTFNEGGTYPVTLTVWDAAGESSSTTQMVTVAHTRPTVRIDWNPHVPVQNELVGLVAYVHDPEDDVVSVDWTFSDGKHLSGKMTYRGFEMIGTYDMTVVATDAKGRKGWANDTITVVNAPPQADFHVVPQKPTAGQPAKLVSVSKDAAGGSIVNSTWRISGIATPFYGEEVMLAFPRDGFVPVELTVTDNEGASATKERAIEVLNPPPIVAITYSPVYPNPSTTVSFVASIQDDDLPKAATWTFPGGVKKNGLAVSHTFPDGGTYPVSLEVVDTDGGKGTATRLVRVNHAPVAHLAASDDSVETHVPVVFTGSATDLDGNTTSFTWHIDGQQLADVSACDLTTPTVVTCTWGDNGDHTARLTAKDPNGAVSVVTKTVAILNRKPTLMPEVLTPVLNLNSDITFRANAQDADLQPGETLTIEWFKQGASAPFALGEQVTTRFDDPGATVVTVRATDPDGDFQNANLSLTINSPPIITDLGFTPDSPLANTQVQFFVSAHDIDGDPLTYLWDFGDGSTSTLEDPVHTFALGGDYSVRVTVTDINHNAAVTQMLGVTVRAPDLTGSLGVSPSIPYAGTTSTLQVTINPERSIEGIEWYVDDNNVGSTGPNVNSLSYTFPEPRLYDLRAEVTADLGAREAFTNVVRVAGASPFPITLRPVLPDDQCVNLTTPGLSIQAINQKLGTTIGLDTGTHQWSVSDECTLTGAFPIGSWSRQDGLTIQATVGNRLTTLTPVSFSGTGVNQVPWIIKVDLVLTDLVVHDRQNDPFLPTPETGPNTYVDPTEPVFVSGIVRWADGTIARGQAVTLAATYFSPVSLSLLQLNYATWSATSNNLGAFTTFVPAPVVGAVADASGGQHSQTGVFPPGQYSVSATVRHGDGTSNSKSDTFMEDPQGILALLRDNGLLTSPTLDALSLRER